MTSGVVGTLLIVLVRTCTARSQRLQLFREVAQHEPSCLFDSLRTVESPTLSRNAIYKLALGLPISRMEHFFANIFTFYSFETQNFLFKLQSLKYSSSQLRFWERSKKRWNSPHSETVTHNVDSFPVELKAGNTPLSFLNHRSLTWSPPYVFGWLNKTKENDSCSTELSNGYILSKSNDIKKVITIVDDVLVQKKLNLVQ